MKLGALAKKPVPTKDARKARLWNFMESSSCTDVFLLIGGIILSVVSGALMPLNSLIFRGMTDTLLQGEANRTAGHLNMDVFASGVIHYCLMYLTLGICLLVVGYLANACLYILCERRIHHIRKRYLRAVMQQDMTWFDSQSTGALTQKMSSGVERIKDGCGDKLGVVLNAIGTFVSGLTVGFFMCWQMTLVMLISVPLMLTSMYVTGRLLSRATKSESSAYSEAGALALEVLEGIKTVISFNAQPFEISRYETLLKQARRKGIRKAYILAACAAVPMALMFATMSVAFWYGTLLVSKGIVSPGTIFGVFWAVLIGTNRLGMAAPQLGVILSARLAIKDIFTIILRNPEIDCYGDIGRVSNEIEGNLVFTNIEFAYPSRPQVKVLKGISFEVHAGESVALVGSSGCGKSTILGILQRFYEQDAGVVMLDDVPLRDYNVKWLRDNIGVVQQDPVIFVATVAENIRMGDHSISDEDLLSACREANAHDFIMQLNEDYGTVIGEGAVQLSGGQKQRIAIARALVRQPRILLLDEATSALDTESEHVVQTALDKAREGRTTISVAHRLSTVRNADKIFVFDVGSIVEEGTHDDLMNIEDGVYYNMVKMQEITKAEDDTTLDDVDPVEIRRALSKDSKSDEKMRSASSLMERESSRIRTSMISTSTQEPDWLLESAREEMEEEGAMEASLMDIFRYSKPEIPGAFVGFLFAILRGLTWPVFSIIYGQLFLLLTSTDPEALTGSSWLNSLWFLLLAIMTGVATFASGSLFGVAGERMAMRLRMDVYKNLMRQDVAYFHDPKHNTGTLTSRLASDAPNVQAAIDQRLSDVLQGVCSLTGGIIVAFSFGWNMAPIGLATTLVLVAAQSAVAQYLKHRGHSDLKVATEASRLVTESLLNVKCIQSLNRQDFMFKAYCSAAREPHRRAITRGLWQSLSLALSNSFVLLNFAVAYLFGLWLIKNNWSTPFIVFQVIEALNMASVSVTAAASYFPEYVRARISAGILFSMMRTSSKIDNLSHVGESPVLKGDISLRNVHFAYPNRKRFLILNGMSISAKFGQTVALVGPSGCGKSTVIQLLERFFDPLCGSVMLDTHDARDLAVRHMRDHIALVGQEPVLFNVSIRDNISYGLDSCSQESIEKAAQLANIHQFITSLPEGYDTMVGARGGKLSGGQKQRISIARAMVRDPKILLLDEATSALDSESEKVVQEALDRARLGRTCIVIAHRLSSIQTADVIVVCRDGKVLEKGNHQSLLARKGLYYRLVEKQHS